METDKIYVRYIDGTEHHEAINARQLNENLFEILDDPAYNDLDESELFEFYPGDIVSVEDTRDMDNEYQFDAKQLIRLAPHPDRKYLEFKFYGTLRQLQINNETYHKYAPEIERIKREKSEGKFFYRGILETIEGFDSLGKK